MSVVVRLKSNDTASNVVAVVGDSSLGLTAADAVAPSASPVKANSPHLVQCLHCGVLNGHSAAVCWGCENELSEIRSSAFGAELMPEAAEEADWPSAGDSFAAVRSLAEAASPLPVLATPVAVEGWTSTHRVAAVVMRRRLGVIAGLAAVATIMGVGAYLWLGAPTIDDLVATTIPGGSYRSGGAVADPDSNESTPVGPTQTSSTRSIAADAVPPGTGAPVVDANVQSHVEPGAVAAVQAGRAARSANQAREARRANAATARAEKHAGKSSAALRSANADAVIPPSAPNRFEPTQQVPASIGPCTSAVAALGLCTPPPIQPRQ